jgi:hypothetical protein
LIETQGFPSRYPNFWAAVHRPRLVTSTLHEVSFVACVPLLLQTTTPGEPGAVVEPADSAKYILVKLLLKFVNELSLTMVTFYYFRELVVPNLGS